MFNVSNFILFTCICMYIIYFFLLLQVPFNTHFLSISTHTLIDIFIALLFFFNKLCIYVCMYVYVYFINFFFVYDMILSTFHYNHF